MEKAREATDAANIRAAYAEVQTAALEDDTANETKDVALKQTQDGWQSSIEDIGGISVKDLEVGKGKTVEVKYTPGTNGAEGDTTITIK